jgi:sterol desaturase/sphingolipid hydroxylase (fatty acid hydroxylase superfamily)
MDMAFLAYEATLVGCVFWLTLALVTTWEWAAPRRALGTSLRLRWGSNFGVWILNDLIGRWVYPVVGVAFALLAAEWGWGFFNAVPVPGWLAVIVSIPLLDLIAYWVHRLFHQVPVLWRVHRLHHSDVDCDVTAGLRIHPLQMLGGTAIMLAAIAVLGAPPLAVLVDRVLSAVSGPFTHANVRMPARWEARLRRVFVTPEMHRVHHSARPTETDSNYGQLYPWWDRLFGTYVAQPRDGHEGMTIGLERFRERKHSRLDWMLAQPFLR